MQQNIPDNHQNKKSRGRRWRMKGISIPSFRRSRSTEWGEAEPPGAGPPHLKDEPPPPPPMTSSSRLPAKMSFWKRKSANITEYDPTYRVVYLGNVLTGWAKGDGCVDKPLSTLWRNHIGSDKPDIMMKVTVVGSGLRALTKEHGLTEYWANRITYSVAHPSYPRVFCWIYRHEGRKMKQELRCHAVLCPKEEKAKQMATALQDRLHQALIDFKKEKISRQNARLSLANCLHDNPGIPYRKLLLQAATSNYKPPIERSKSAPKLTSIEEAELEEEEEYEYEIPLEEDEDLHLPHHHHHVAEIHVYPGRGTESRVPPLDSPVMPSSIYLEGESEDEDEIRDYLGAGAGEVDSAQSSSPGSEGRSEPGPRDPDSASLSDHSDAGHAECIGDSLGKMKMSEQDTISDESGYSEEPISGRDVTVVQVTGEPTHSTMTTTTTNNRTSLAVMNEHKLSIELNAEDPGYSISGQSISIPARRQSVDISLSGSTSGSPGSTTGSLSPVESSPRSPGSTRDSISPVEDSPRSPSPGTPLNRNDLSVKSVLLSEFTASEKMKYIERSNIKTPVPAPLVLKRQEFCINI